MPGRRECRQRQAGCNACGLEKTACRRTQRVQLSEHPDEHERRRHRERQRETVQPGERLACEGEWNLQDDRGEREQRQFPSRWATKTTGKVTETPIETTDHSESRSTRRPSSEPTWTRNPPRAAVDDPRTGDREDPGCRPDHHDREPGRGDHVARCPGWVEAKARERNGRDEAERRRRHHDDRRGDQVRVAEARDRPRPFPAREREADDVDGLQRERQRDAGSQLPQPSAEEKLARAHRPRRHPRSSRTQGERDGGNRDRDRAVQRHAPSDRVDAVGLDTREDVDKAHHAAHGVAGGGDSVVVESRERARGEPRVQLEHRCNHHPRESRLRRVVRGLGAVAGEEPASGPARRARARPGVPRESRV